MSRVRALTAVSLTLIASLGLAGCSASSTAAEGESDSAATESAAPEILTVTHAQGETEVPVNPENVIVFDLASLDTLDALGVDVAGVAKGNLPDYLSKYDADSYLNAGTLFEPDLTAVEAAQPDLIIVANRSSEAYADLSEIAPTIDLTLDWEDYLGSFTANTETIGEIFDKEDEVADALAEIDEKVQKANAADASVGNGLIVMTSAGEVTAYGADSRFGWIHDELGVVPAAEDVDAATHGDPVSFEYILETDPDWLFVIDRDVAVGETGASAKEVLSNELVEQTTAWSKDQVIYLDAPAAYVVMSGLTATNTLVDQVVEGLS